eukprot:3380901-Prymnesium_polylepis.1
MSRSKPTVPQPSATFSVSLILGIAFWASLCAAPAMRVRWCISAGETGTRRESAVVATRMAASLESSPDESCPLPLRAIDEAEALEAARFFCATRNS